MICYKQIQHEWDDWVLFWKHVLTTTLREVDPLDYVEWRPVRVQFVFWWWIADMNKQKLNRRVCSWSAWWNLNKQTLDKPTIYTSICQKLSQEKFSCTKGGKTVQRQEMPMFFWLRKLAKDNKNKPGEGPTDLAFLMGEVIDVSDKFFAFLLPPKKTMDNFPFFSHFGHVQNYSYELKHVVGF